MRWPGSDGSRVRAGSPDLVAVDRPPVHVGSRTVSPLRRPRCPRRSCPEGQSRRPRRRARHHRRHRSARDPATALPAIQPSIGERFYPMDLLPGTSVSRWARSCRRSGLSRWGGGLEEDGSSTFSRSRSSARMRARAIRSRVAIAGGRGGDRGRQRPGLAAAGLAGEEPEAGLGGEPPEDSSEAHVGVPLLITSYATTRASGAENFGCISGCFLPYTRGDRPD